MNVKKKKEEKREIKVTVGGNNETLSMLQQEKVNEQQQNIQVIKKAAVYFEVMKSIHGKLKRDHPWQGFSKLK